MQDRQTAPLDRLALADLLTAAIAQRPPEARVTGIAAGMHAVIQLPPALGPEPRITAALRQASMHLRTLSGYQHGQPSPTALIIGYATPSGHACTSALAALLGAFT